MRFCVLIRRLRYSSGLSLRQCADKAGVSLSEWEAWEDGSRVPSTKQVDEIACKYRCETCRAIELLRAALDEVLR